MAPKSAAKHTGRKKSKDMKRLSLPIPKGYTFPLKKRREKVKTMTERVITTAQELRTYAKAFNEIVVIYGLFLWGSFHTTERGRHIAHLHLYDAVADDSLADLLENDKYEDDCHFDTDKELMTATVWDVVEESNGLPSPVTSFELRTLPAWVSFARRLANSIQSSLMCVLLSTQPLLTSKLRMKRNLRSSSRSSV
ncbi:hypothetical protein GN958_ATG16539 [Phytophthora infestans]|uniref:Uncharacterized protein n=1 Tax=Phytophthora infestans TaxID=4787 RepID=A0A8S9U4Y6_PHYIN|nr:hypothetical protein GN958_ATG16539 [Phytophthora infestans]